MWTSTEYWSVSRFDQSSICAALVRERCAHPKQVTSCAAKIPEAALCQNNNTSPTIVEGISINCTDVCCLDFVLRYLAISNLLFEPRDICSVSKCPILQRIASFGICSMCLPRMMSLLPVVVTNSFLLYSVFHCDNFKAFHGSLQCIDRINRYNDTASMALRPAAQPLPTSPYPQTTATLPASIISVARLTPSASDSRQP